MEVEMEQTAVEIKRLKACINDLVSVLALPAIWSGTEPSQIIGTLLDVLLGILRLDFAYARLSDSICGGSPIEMVRLAQHRNRTTPPQAIGLALNAWLEVDPRTSPLLVRNPIGEGDVSIVPVRLGFQDEVGVLVAGSRRADFPRETERLLLGVATNQAAIGLQEARLLSDQRRVAEKVEQQVGERTRQLTSVNDELRKEIIERKRAEESLRRAQADLAHVSRLTTMGELVASIAHEVNQPLGAIVTNGHACVRLLSREVPDLDKAREVIGRMISDGMRASEVIKRIRDLLHKTPTEKAPLNINEPIQEVIALVSSDVHRSRVKLFADLATDLPPVIGDRVQLQQVILNLILNSKDAMSAVQTHPREMLITSRQSISGQVVVAVRDSGKGLEPRDADRIFDPFFSTKQEGMGLGLSISRRIIEDHGGRLFATQNEPQGAVFQFTLPAENESTLWK